MYFSVTAPGKIILSGEHAVVYGYKGIASSINLRCKAAIRIPKEDNKIVSLHLENIPFDFEFNEIEYNMLLSNVGKHRSDATSPIYQSIMKEFLDEKIHESLRDDQYIYQGLLVFLDLCLMLLTDNWQSIDITVNSEFSYGCGLGSSAAYATVLATALSVIRDSSWLVANQQLSMGQLQLISALAFRGEQIVHGAPSGIDNCISTFGGALLFQRSQQSITRCPVAAPHLPILLIDTRVKRCTKTVVKHVQSLVTENSDKFHGYFAAIDDIAVRLASQLLSNGAVSLNGMVEENQAILRKIGVSHESIDEVVDVLERLGLAGKLTGAGWGGCVFAFVNGVSADVIEDATLELVARGYGVRLTHLSCPGVSIDPEMED